jgi:hypothetical protein
MAVGRAGIPELFRVPIRGPRIALALGCPSGLPSTKACRQPDSAQSQPSRHGWEVRTHQDGTLTAVLTGLYPPITVSAADIDGLRKNIRTLIMRTML